MSRRALWCCIVGLLIIGACTATPEGEPSVDAETDGAEEERPEEETGQPVPTVDDDDDDAGGDPLSPQGDLPVAMCWSFDIAGDPGGIELADDTEGLGFNAPLTGMLGHAFAAGDLTADGWLDVFVGSFADRPEDVYQVRGASGPSPDRVLLGGPGGLAVDDRFPSVRERTSGALFADLTLDGHLDLVAARNPRGEGRGAGPTTVYRNDGAELSEAAALLPDVAARAVAPLDLDGDAKLDLFVVADRWGGGSSVLLRNDGELSFTDVTAAAGLPVEGLHGLGAGAADLTGNGHTDVFVAGDNRLFINRGDGTFREADSGVFDWETFGNEDEVAGIAIADLTRNGRPDIVLGHHYNSTVDFGERVPVRLYLNDGVDDRGDPTFRDVTEQAGLADLPTKAPHVELADIDNDGWPDIVTSASAKGGKEPAIFRHEGLVDGIPRFSTPEGLGEEQYWVTGGAIDLTRDGRLEILQVEWFPELPSRLWVNTGDVGNAIQVQVPPHAFGAAVEAYETGELGEPDALIASREVIGSIGYAAGGPPIVHLGLGDRASIDLRVTLPDGRVAELVDTPVNRHLRAAGDCP